MCTHARRSRKWLSNAKNGQILVVTAVLLIALLAMMALVIDTGRIEAARRYAQRAADAAAQAAAYELLNGNGATQQANARTAANSYATFNGISSTNNVNNVLVEIPPSSASGSQFANSNGYAHAPHQHNLHAADPEQTHHPRPSLRHRRGNYQPDSGPDFGS